MAAILKQGHAFFCLKELFPSLGTLKAIRGQVSTSWQDEVGNTTQFF